MVDGKRVLDALMGAMGQRPPGAGASSGQGGGFLDQALQTLGPALGQILGTGQSPSQAGAPPAARGSVPPAGGPREAPAQAGAAGDPFGGALSQFGGANMGDLAAKAKDFMARNPGVAEAAALSAAGLLFGSRGGRGVAGSLVKLGGLAVIGSLAYKAFQQYQGGAQQGTPAQPMPAPAPQGELAPPATRPHGGSSPERSPLWGEPVSPASFDPDRASDSDALRLARAMVAAANADGHIDDEERSRITAGFSQAGIGSEVTGWLQSELARPASVEDLARGVTAPELAAQVYAAARVAIEPDTAQERDFLARLAEALKLDPALKRHLDEAASAIKQ